jgi:hypothetical protein
MEQIKKEKIVTLIKEKIDLEEEIKRLMIKKKY